MICGSVILTIRIGARKIFGIFHQRRELQMSDLKGTALVTGATGGAGTFYAAGLAERGYDLLFVGHQQKTLDTLAKAVKQKVNVKVETLVAGLAKAKDLARVM
jgi:uncharacterized protein